MGLWWLIYNASLVPNGNSRRRWIIGSLIVWGVGFVVFAALAVTYPAPHR